MADKVTQVCQLPMYNLLWEPHQPVINGPASPAQYDPGQLAVQHRDTLQKILEQCDSVNIHHLLKSWPILNSLNQI